MESLFSLNEKIDVLIKKKSSVCECNPCICSEKTKENYFRELKDVLTGFNQDYLATHLTKINLLNLSTRQNSITYY
jgi:hypothetical protein